MSSTAPYFVDDRLYCAEEDMQNNKPLHLCVSLVPKEPKSSMGPQAETGLSADSGDQGSPRRTPRARAKSDASEEAQSPVVTHDKGGTSMTKDGGGAVQGPASTLERTPAAQQPDVPTGDDVQSTPWALDICLVRVAGVCR